MVITTKVNVGYTQKVGAGYIKRRALTRLRYFKFGTTEELLNEYLKAKYGISLIFACRNIILRSRIETNKKDNSYTITILDKYWERMVRIITFGTGKLTGSELLRVIFNEIK